MSDPIASPSGVIIPTLKTDGLGSTTSGIPRSGRGPPQVTTTARGLRGPTPRNMASAGGSPSSARHHKGPSTSSGLNESGFSVPAAGNIQQAASATPLNGTLSTTTTSVHEPTPRAPHLQQQQRSATGAGQQGKSSSPLAASGATPSDDGDGLLGGTSASLKMEMTMAMSGKMMPRMQQSASRADVILNLQQKLRTEYEPMLRPEARGLFWTENIAPSSASGSAAKNSGGGSGSAAATAATAEARARQLHGRRAAQLSDPTQRATVTVVREDGIVLSGGGQQLTDRGGGAQQQPQQTTSALEQIRGATCIADGLPARLAGQDGRGLGGVVVVIGPTGIGRSTICKQLCAQQRVPEALVVHVPLFLLRNSRRFTNDGSRTARSGVSASSPVGVGLQLLKVEDLVAAVEAPLSRSDVAAIVRHRIPIVWALENFEAERRHCPDFVKRMVELRRWRDVAMSAGNSPAGGGGAAGESDETKLFWESYNDGDDQDDDAFNNNANEDDESLAASPYALLTRKCDTVIVTSADGTLSEQDAVDSIESLSATSVTSIAQMATSVRASNVERWVVQRWPQTVTREFCRRYCTSKGKPYSATEKMSASASASATTGGAGAAAGGANRHNMMPAEDVVWRVLGSGSFRSFAGIPLLCQCVCDVFLLNESLLPQLISQNPAVTLFDLLLKLQWSRQLPHVQALLSSSLLADSDTMNHDPRTAGSAGGAGRAQSTGNLSSRSQQGGSFNASYSRIARSPDEAYKAMIDAAGLYCVELISKNGMECDVTIFRKRQQHASATNNSNNNDGEDERSALEAGLAAMNEQNVDTSGGSGGGMQVEPLWVKLLSLLGVVKRISTKKKAVAAPAAAGVPVPLQQQRQQQQQQQQQQNFTQIVFHNRLLVEYFAACHISRHPEAVAKIRFHQSNRFLWMALAFFSARNTRTLSTLGFFSRISERYAKEHPLWLESLADTVAGQFHARYASLPEDLRHSRKKMLLLSQFTQCNLLVELSAILGNPYNTVRGDPSSKAAVTSASEAKNTINNEAETLMGKVRRKHGFFGSTLRCPSHFTWSFEWCGEYGALGTLNWLIEKYPEEMTSSKPLLSRALARALRREQLGGADRAGGVIHRLRQLGAVVELFTAVGLGSTTAVSEALETPGLVLDADSFRTCLILCIENHDSDMAALLLSHARIAEYLDAWVVAAVFVLQSRVRFARRSVQHTLDNDFSSDAATAAASRSAARATSSEAMMGTLEFLDRWTTDCGGMAERELNAINMLMHQILSKQAKMTEVHTAAINEGGAAATFAAAIASLDTPDSAAAAAAAGVHHHQQHLEGSTGAALGSGGGDHSYGSIQMVQSTSVSQRQLSSAAGSMSIVSQQQQHQNQTPSAKPVVAAAGGGDDDDDDGDGAAGEVDLGATIMQAGGAIAAAAVSAAESGPTSPTSARRRRGGAASASGQYSPNPHNPNNASGEIDVTDGGTPRSDRSRATSFFQGFSYGTDFVVEVRIDAIFWWAAGPSSSLATKPAADDDAMHYVPFYQFPDSVQLRGIVQTLGDCESVKHIILRLQECESLSDATLIQLVHAAGPKLVELGVTWANEITDSAMLSLTRYCRNLAVLDVTRCYCLTNASMIAAAAHFHHLRSLCLEFVGMIDDDGVIAMCESDPCIERLSLAYCTQITDRALLVVAQRLRSLVSLTVSGCELLTDCALVNVALNCTSTLSSLHFRDLTEVTDAGVVAVAESLQERLLVLDMAVCWRLTDDALGAVGKNCPNLEELYISDVNSIGSKGVKALAENSSGKLRVLDISGCFAVSGKALSMLCNKSMATLEELYVSRCDGVDDEFTAAMTSGCPRLRTLHVSYCEAITDKTLVSVLGNKSIRDFQVMPTPTQERENVFSATLMHAVTEKIEQRNIRVAAEEEI